MAVNLIHPIDAAAAALATFFRAQVSGLTVLDEWPYGNQPLAYPSLTISRGKSKRMPMQPEQLSVSTMDAKKRVVVTEVVASYDTQFQLDLWARNKLERTQVLNQIIDAMNAAEVDASGNNNSDGLSLQMSNYFNEWVRYEIDSHEPMDDESAAQRQERREKIVVLVNLREVRQRTLYAMTNIEVHEDTTVTDQDSGTIETFDV